jgi:hypothetical protein
VINEEVEHGNSDGGLWRQLGEGRCHVLGIIEDHSEVETSTPGCIVSIVPCFETCEPVLDGVG